MKTDNSPKFDINGRQSNIELLRVVAILLVIIFHLGFYTLRVQLGGGVSSVGGNANSFHFKLLILETTQTFGQIGNDIFNAVVEIIDDNYREELQNKENNERIELEPVIREERRKITHKKRN